MKYEIVGLVKLSTPRDKTYPPGSRTDMRIFGLSRRYTQVRLKFLFKAKIDSALFVDLDDLYSDLIADIDHVGNFLDAFFS